MKFFCKMMAVVLASLSVFAVSSLASAPKYEAQTLPKNTHAWLAYWDLQAGVRDAKKHKVKHNSIFAVTFNEKNELVLPEHFQSDLFSEREFLKVRKNLGGKQYLAFVNDKQLGEKKFAMKDIELLRTLLGTEAGRLQHAQAVIAATKAGKYYGIEIDYENIWKDAAVVKDFTSFIEILGVEAQKVKLPVRVVLEPKSLPYAESFPANAEYVLMLYNLYGTHSGPGPKADAKFIERTLKKFAQVPGQKSVALATGGFRWEAGSKKVVGLTEAQAAALAKQYNAKVERDEASQALYFSYVEKKDYTVWYADRKTLEYWYGVSVANGFKDVNLWRLGGNL